MSPFPTAVWNGEEITFVPGLSVSSPKFVLLFAIGVNGVVLADIEGRGWTVPSGRVEVGESALEAIRREALEEAGLALGSLSVLGSFVVVGSGEGRSMAFGCSSFEFVASPSLESRGVRECGFEELAGVYGFWNPLTEAVFRFAFEACGALLPER